MKESFFVNDKVADNTILKLFKKAIKFDKFFRQLFAVQNIMKKWKIFSKI